VIMRMSQAVGVVRRRWKTEVDQGLLLFGCSCTSRHVNVCLSLLLGTKVSSLHSLRDTANQALHDNVSVFISVTGLNTVTSVSNGKVCWRVRDD
jgi:hypothetical protein